MDDSLYSDPAGLQGSSQGTAHGQSSTRFPSSTHMNARNLFDESMDLDGAGTQDTDLPDEHSDFRRNKYDTAGSYAFTGTSQTNGQGPRLPSSELERIQLHDRTAHTTTAAGPSMDIQDTPVSTAAHDDGDELPTLPPLSAEERRQQALTRERDDLAKMNTLLEHAISSINRTVPKMKVSLYLHPRDPVGKLKPNIFSADLYTVSILTIELPTNDEQDS
jgi:hypothetical protein